MRRGCLLAIIFFGRHVFLPPRSGAPVRLDTPAEQLCAD
jgi:hypothetical protein